MAQWLNIIAVLLAPILLYAALAWLFNQWVGVAVLGSLGLVSLLLQNWWIGLLTGQFLLRKHTILAGFREK
jgi:hypothetical protein